MTTTPAPNDIDTLKALERAAGPAPWRTDEQYAYDEHPLYGPDGAVGLTWSAPDAELIATMRNALPALLDELANERWLRENAGKVCDNAVAATHEIAKQRDAALGERDAVREELAKVRAELDETERALNKLTLTVRAFPHAANAANIAHARAQRDAYCAELAEAKTLLHTIWHGTVNAPARAAWLRLIRDVNPATTAGAADEQDDESLFESHRLADGTMPDTIPVSDPEHDAPDGATVDGYTRQRNTWVKNDEPADEPKATR